MEIDHDAIAAIAARLDLREPNRVALESVVFAAHQHHDVDAKANVFEAVVVSATAVGKTYVIAAIIEYMAGVGVRDFAVVTPGRTILDKTVANFTPGHPKSLLSNMDVKPVVITSENFATPAMRAAMEDPDEVKLYVFTVQALTKPETKTGRKTHKFQEGLGKAFYKHLQGVSELVVFADEHHTYYGPAFSKAIRELQPYALIGLTATPHKKTPEEQIVFRYPLSMAIADRLVKAPVIVGRKDDRHDAETKLRDGLRLLNLKQQALERYCAEQGLPSVRAVMLVIAKDIDDANECGAILKDPAFDGGRYAAQTLVVHSDAPDEALAELDKVERDSSVRVIISVGMLKEGWDVKNVYVIVSLRASVSEILTEQTLGRGLRLPFGRYTDIEFLDTLEVLAHERYEELLKKADVINQSFIDHRTRAVLRHNMHGQEVTVVETEEVGTKAVVDPGGATESALQYGVPVRPTVAPVDDRSGRVEAEVARMNVELYPRDGLATLKIPRLIMTAVEQAFSIADITDRRPFRELGERIAADPVGELRRTRLGARVVIDRDGLPQTRLERKPAIDKIESPGSLMAREDAIQELLRLLMSAPIIPARGNQRAALGPLIDAFIEGLGDKADIILSGYMDRAAAGLIELITKEHTRFIGKPKYDEVTELHDFKSVRVGRPETSEDRAGPVKRGVGYTGWKKAMHEQVWFDSTPEKEVANVLDESDEVEFWVRLHTNDLPILWSSAGRHYNPDFIVVGKEGTHYIVEVKSDKDITSEDVQGKREAALRWANHVSADEKVGVRWEYILLTESDVKAAKGDWAALRRLGAGG